MRRYTRECLIMLVLSLVTFVVFWRVLDADFLFFDDGTNIYKNEHIQSLDSSHLAWMFGDFAHALRYKPLSWLTWAIIYQFSALNPSGYHLANLLFHTVNVLLTFLVLRKLAAICVPQKDEIPTYTLYCAAIGALAWGVHPLRVEPIAWATGLPYDQSLAFMLISLLCYLYAQVPGQWHTCSRKFYFGSIVAFLLASFTYPIVFGYFGVLIVLDIFVLRRFDQNGKTVWWDAAAKRVWLEKIPFLAFTAVLVLLTVYGRIFHVGDWPEAIPLSQFGLLARIMQAFYVWAYYVWKPWWPVGLCSVYTTLLWNQPLDLPFVLSLVAVVGISVLLLFQRKKWPLLFAVWLCHLGLLVPMLGLTERPHYTNDRYSIIVSLCWSAVITIGLLKLRLSDSGRKIALGCAAVILITLSVMSAQQTLVWQNNVAFYQDMAAKLDNNPYRASALLQLGNSYLAIGDNQKAEEALLQSLKLDPGYVKAHASLADTYANQGRFEQAIQQYNETLRLDSNHVVSHVHLAIVLSQQNRLADALAHFKAALALDESNIETHLNYGSALLKSGSTAAAIEEFNRVLQLSPNHPDALNLLAEARRVQSGKR